MDWIYNENLKLWAPVPDILEMNNSIEQIEKRNIKNFQTVRIPNGPTRAIDYEVEAIGNSIYFRTPCNLEIKLNNQESASIKVSHGDRIKGKFFKLYITADSRTEKDIIIEIGINAEYIHEKSEDLDFVEEILNPTFPLSLDYDSGESIDRWKGILVINSTVTPAKYIDDVIVQGQKYSAGALKTVFSEKINLTAFSTHYGLNFVAYNYQVDTVGPNYQNAFNFEVYPALYAMHENSFTIDKLVINLDVSVTGTISQSAYRLWKQRS